MSRTIKYKLNKFGESITKCPNGLTTFLKNAPKIVGYHCMFCRYKEHIDFDNHEVKCKYVKKDKK